MKKTLTYLTPFPYNTLFTFSRRYKGSSFRILSTLSNSVSDAIISSSNPHHNIEKVGIQRR